MYNKIELVICNCKAGERYFDSFRNMFVYMTAEEKIRQKTCLIMSDELGVPREVIKVEERLVHYGVKDKNGRIDISITFFDEDGNERPLVIIECKEERIPVIAQQVKEQGAEYASCIGAAYFIVTNGVEMYYYHV